MKTGHGLVSHIIFKELELLLLVALCVPFWQPCKHYIWEDIYIIGLCAVKARLHILTSKRFYYLKYKIVIVNAGVFIELSINRIFVDEPETYPDPCFVRNTVMWTTSSEDHINSSHIISHNLYRNDTKSYCVLKTYVMGPNETLVDLVQSQISEPAIASEFKFRSIHSKVFGD